MENLITYDLRKPGRDYSTLYDAIKSFGNWAHPVESVWIIDTTKNPGDIRDYLKQHVDSNDVLFVVQLHQNWASSNLPPKNVDWLKSSIRSW
jgi:hypothetical protein